MKPFYALLILLLRTVRFARAMVKNKTNSLSIYQPNGNKHRIRLTKSGYAQANLRIYLILRPTIYKKIIP
jgi:hypothetical protein